MVQMNLFAGQKLRHSCREQTYGHQGGKVAGGKVHEDNWVIEIDMYTLMCIQLMTNKNLLYKKKFNKIQKLKKKTTLDILAAENETVNIRKKKRYAY